MLLAPPAWNSRHVAAAAGTPTVSVAPDVGTMVTGRAAQVTAVGYVEKEFFLEGTAQSYAKRGDWGADGAWTAAPADNAPYKIRMLARYPADPARFNGLVLVEWLNVSGQSEGDPNFSSLHVELVREGYAYVGVGAQNAGINGANGLKKQNAARYGALQHPGDSYS